MVPVTAMPYAAANRLDSLKASANPRQPTMTDIDAGHVDLAFGFARSVDDAHVGDNNRAVWPAALGNRRPEIMAWEAMTVAIVARATMG